MATFTVSDVLNEIEGPGGPISDSDVSTWCDKCGRALTLADCRVTESDGLVYSCPGCGSSLVTIRAPAEQPWPDRGIRIGKFVIRAAVNLWIGKSSKFRPAKA